MLDFIHKELYTGILKSQRLRSPFWHTLDLFYRSKHFSWLKKDVDYVPFLLFLRFPPSFLSFGFTTFFSSPDSPSSLTVSFCLSSLCLYLGFLDVSSSSESDSELPSSFSDFFSSFSFSPVTQKSQYHVHTSHFLTLHKLGKNWNLN